MHRASFKPARVTWGLPEVRTCVLALVPLRTCVPALVPLGSLGSLRIEVTGITEALALFSRVNLTFSGQK